MSISGCPEHLPIPDDLWVFPPWIGSDPSLAGRMLLPQNYQMPTSTAPQSGQNWSADTPENHTDAKNLKNNTYHGINRLYPGDLRATDRPGRSAADTRLDVELDVAIFKSVQLYVPWDFHTVMVR